MVSPVNGEFALEQHACERECHGLQATICYLLFVLVLWDFKFISTTIAYELPCIACYKLCMEIHTAGNAAKSEEASQPVLKQLLTFFADILVNWIEKNIVFYTYITCQ